MKRTLLFIILGLFISVSSSQREQFYQVITSHPHDLEELIPYADTTFKNGRLWVIRLKDGAPSHLLKLIRPLSGKERSYLHRVDSGEVSKSRVDFRNKKDVAMKFIDGVDKELITKDVEELASYESRYVGTADNQAAVDKVEERFKDMGYVTKRVCYVPEACGILAEKKGKKKSSQVILIAGHIDSVGESFAGADDNGSGMAVMLEMARNLKDYKNKKTIRFFVTNGEEAGLLGSKFYVRNLESQNKLKDIQLMINMDMVGYNKNGILELETNPEFESLAKWYGDLAVRYTNLKPKITLGAWGSDHVPFLEKKVPSILTLEDWNTKNPCYHMECDKTDIMNFDYAAQVARLNIGAVITKDLQ